MTESSSDNEAPIPPSPARESSLVEPQPDEDVIDRVDIIDAVDHSTLEVDTSQIEKCIEHHPSLPQRTFAELGDGGIQCDTRDGGEAPQAILTSETPTSNKEEDNSKPRNRLRLSSLTIAIVIALVVAVTIAAIVGGVLGSRATSRPHGFNSANIAPNRTVVTLISTAGTPSPSHPTTPRNFTLQEGPLSHARLAAVGWDNQTAGGSMMKLFYQRNNSGPILASVFNMGDLKNRWAVVEEMDDSIPIRRGTPIAADIRNSTGEGEVRHALLLVFETSP